MPSASEPKVAVVGATGTVGGQIVELISDRAFPSSELVLFATQKGASGTIESGDDEYLIEKLDSPADLARFDIAFLATPEEPALEIVNARPGPILIDLSAASRAPTDAMLIPGISPEKRTPALRTSRLFAVPNPVAHVLAICLGAAALDSAMVFATGMQGAAASGREMIARTVDQTTDLLSARLDLGEDETQRAFNAFVRESERALAGRIAEQTAAMLAPRAIRLAVQLITIPILHGTSLAIHFDKAADSWLENLRAAPGILMADEGEPLSVIDAVGQEAIIARAEETVQGAEIWCAFDNARLAALDALWIAESFALKTPAGN